MIEFNTDDCNLEIVAQSKSIQFKIEQIYYKSNYLIYIQPTYFDLVQLKQILHSEQTQILSFSILNNKNLITKFR